MWQKIGFSLYLVTSLGCTAFAALTPTSTTLPTVPVKTAGDDKNSPTQKTNPASDLTTTFVPLCNAWSEISKAAGKCATEVLLRAAGTYAGAKKVLPLNTLQIDCGARITNKALVAHFFGPEETARLEQALSDMAAFATETVIRITIRYPAITAEALRTRLTTAIATRLVDQHLIPRSWGILALPLRLAAFFLVEEWILHGTIDLENVIQSAEQTMAKTWHRLYETPRYQLIGSFVMHLFKGPISRALARTLCAIPFFKKYPHLATAAAQYLVYLPTAGNPLLG